MTLELVELLGHSLLGGNTLAAAGVFSSRVYKINACTGGSVVLKQWGVGVAPNMIQNRSGVRDFWILQGAKRV